MPLEVPPTAIDQIPPSLVQLRTILVTAFSLALAAVPCAASPESIRNKAEQRLVDQAGFRHDAHVHAYLDESLKHLAKHVPELAELRRTKDQSLLPVILQKTGDVVAHFFRNMVDVAAQEEVRQEVFGPAGARIAVQNVKYSYLILAKSHQVVPAYYEYRTDPKGQESEQGGIEQGYAITSGFVLKSAYFLPQLQAGSTFRYLGEQTVNSHDTYVVAFAQRPQQAVYWGTVVSAWGKVRVFDQGIAWIDKRSFQIVRIRTDLLAAHSEVGLAEQTTIVTLGEVRITDVPEPLWLPSEVSVYAVYQGQAFRNEHRYSDYERFRVRVLLGNVRFPGDN